MPAKIPVIIDTDPGVDDALAILLAIASPEIEILAYIVSFGNTDVQFSYLNVLRIYNAVSKHLELHPQDHVRFPNFNPSTKPFLVRGAQGPMAGDLHSAKYFHGKDGLAGITERHPDLNPDQAALAAPWFQTTDLSASELITKLISSRPALSTTYIALGPLTNLAATWLANRALIKARLGRVICMGGALDVPGNTTPVAEFNFFADPYAVKELLHPPVSREGFPLERFILLPLDVTTPHQLHFPYYKTHVDPEFVSTMVPSKSHGKSPIAHFTSSFLERTREIMMQFGCDAMELHDVVAVWCALENPPVSHEDLGAIPTLKQGWKAVKRKFDIERTGELTRGMLIVDRRSDVGAYAPGANRAEVQAKLDELHVPHKPFESTALPAQVEVDSPIQARPDQSAWGVACVTETPGSHVLVKLVLERVWGVTVTQQ